MSNSSPSGPGKPGDGNRRRFLKWTVVGGVFVAVSALGYEVSKSGTGTSSSSTSSVETSSSAGVTPATQDFPIGNRAVRIRVLSDDQNWPNTMGSYTAQDVLNWINDLEPTTLNRYFSGPQTASQLLPATPGQSQMTVQEFLQASIDACADPNPTTMFPRLTFNYYQTSPSAFFQDAQSIFDLCSALDPPQTLLSIDDYNSPDVLSYSEALSLADQLLNIGYTGICWGAGGTVGPAGYATFAMTIPVGYDKPEASNWPSNVNPDWSHMQQLQQIGGYGEFEVQIDFPGDMRSMVASDTPDQMAQVFARLAMLQSNNSADNGLGEDFPYHYVYPIYQGKSAGSSNTFPWDSTQYVCQNPPYAGMTLYEVMKSLMREYN